MGKPDIDALETDLAVIATRLEAQLAAYWPVKSMVKVILGARQLRPSTGMVIAHRAHIHGGFVRVLLQTKKGKVVDVHWPKVLAP